MFIPDPDFCPYRIPDLGVKKAPDPDPQHWLKAGLHIRTLLFFNFFQIWLNV
jgi:hypothetical protein